MRQGTERGSKKQMKDPLENGVSWCAQVVCICSLNAVGVHVVVSWVRTERRGKQELKSAHRTIGQVYELHSRNEGYEHVCCCSFNVYCSLAGSV